jgi:hypothetical protein
MLRAREITLLNPATWDDKNDAYFMAEYKRYADAKSVLALCFAECVETYHHWRIFSHGNDGICVEFDKARLLSTFDSDGRIRHGDVTYKLLREIRALKSIPVEDLPFLKRSPYADEREYRVIYVDHDEVSEFQSYELDIKWITRVTLSPWMPRALSKSVKDTIKGINGCSKISIIQSSLVENESWKQATARVKT